jgi:hypothetical protein
MNKSAQSIHSSEYDGSEFQVDDSRAGKFQRFYQDIENMAKSEDANYSKEEIEEIYWSEEVKHLSSVTGSNVWDKEPEYYTKKAMALHNNRRDKLDEVAQETLDWVLEWLKSNPRVCFLCGRVTETAKGNTSHYTQVHLESNRSGKKLKDIGESSLWISEGDRGVRFEIGRGELSIDEFRKFQEGDFVDDVEKMSEKLGMPENKIPFIQSQLPSISNIQNQGLEIQNFDV